MRSRFTFSPSSPPAQPGARVRGFNFVQLVFESAGIAIGRVAAVSAGGLAPITLAVERFFRAELPQQVRIVSQAVRTRQVPRFALGEQVVLFLQAVRDAEAVLLGEGDVAKWPRPPGDSYFTLGHARPLSEVVKAVELLLRIHTLDSFAARVRPLLDELVPAGPLGQIAAAQYASDEERWEQAQSRDGIGLAEMRLLVAAKFLLASERVDPAVDVAVLELLADAPACVGIPILLERLNDPSAGVRGTAFASLQTAALPFTEETFEYDPGGTPEERAAATARWRQWWARQQASSLRSEVPKMLADLDSPHLLRRRAADWSLRLLSKGDAGYVAEGPVDHRKAAAAHWRAWWEQTSQQLR